MALRNKFFIFESDLDLNSLKYLLNKLFELNGSIIEFNEKKINKIQEQIINENVEKLKKKYKNTNFEHGLMYFIGTTTNYTKSINFTLDTTPLFSKLIENTFQSNDREFFKLDLAENAASIDAAVSVYGVFIRYSSKNLLIFYSIDPSTNNLKPIFIDDFLKYLLGTKYSAIDSIDLMKIDVNKLVEWVKKNFAGELFQIDENKYGLSNIQIRLKTESEEEQTETSTFYLNIPYNKIDLLDQMSKHYLNQLEEAHLSTLFLPFEEIKKSEKNDIIFKLPIGVYNNKDNVKINFSGGNINNPLFKKIFAKIMEFIKIE